MARSWIVIACVGLSSGAARAQPADSELLATAEIELVDVSGAGGFSNREPGLIQPRRRAAYVDLDKATLDARFAVTPRLAARLEFRADRTSARIDRVYLDGTVIDSAEVRLTAQLGHQKPMEVPPERRVETYSPLGGLFWRGREWHAGVDAQRRQGIVTFRAIASLAMQRPLGDQAMGEDQGLPSIAFVDTEPLEGSEVEVGGLVGAAAFGAHVDVFGFRGALLDNQGPERLAQTFPDDYELLGDPGNRTSRWLGARAWYDDHGIHALAEAITQRLGLIHRRGFELGASYVVPIRARNHVVELEPFARYGQITTKNLPETFLIPESWDREQVVVAALVRPAAALEIKVEYLILRERAGRSAEGQTAVRDNQLLVQLRLEQALW